MNPDTRDNIPEDALINAQVRVTQYLDDDGEMKFVVGATGDVPLSSFLGLLRLAEHSLIEDSAEW